MYRICTYCVMDTSDPDIRFDQDGRCNHCRRHAALLNRDVLTGEAATAMLAQTVATIRDAGKRKRFDCVIGLSGGVDSTFVALKAVELGLRPLAIHLDNGWNAPEAVMNIKSCVDALGIELETVVLNWPEFRGLQTAFLRASTPDAEIPTDHAITAVLFRTAAREGVRFVVSGHNLATEGLGANAWSQGYHDWRYIRSVNAAFGGRRLATYPHYSWLRHAYWRLVRRITRIELLNMVAFDRATAKAQLTTQLGWKDYGGKHYESVYTRFFQSYLLPRKFGFDKRRAHLSTLISAGSMTRADALDMLQEPPIAASLAARDVDFVRKKLGLSADEFDSIMAMPARTIHDYPSYERDPIYRMLLGVYKRISRTEDPAW